VEHREDAILCQHLIRTGAVPVEALGACAEAQRAARRAAEPVPALGELLVRAGHLSRDDLDAVARAASGKTARRRRRARGRRGDSSSGRWRALGAGVERDGLEVGERIGRYEVTGRIARGSMGAVFAARDIRDGRTVALKVLAGDRARNETGAARFVQEARLACALRHAGLVRGFGFGIDAGRRYFVMERVEAPSLRSRIKHEGPLREGEVLRIGREVAETLAHLHAQGVVHRDVKPANVLTPVDGARSKLCDLGLAREVDLPSEATSSGATLGTPRYMAPEQARGEKDIGPAADLYSLGVTLFHAAAGRPPFTEDSGIVVLSRHLFDEVPDVRSARKSVSPGLAAVIHGLTRRELADRTGSAAEVVAALAALEARVPAPVAPAASAAPAPTAIAA